MLLLVSVMLWRRDALLFIVLRQCMCYLIVQFARANVVHLELNARYCTELEGEAMAEIQEISIINRGIDAGSRAKGRLTSRPPQEGQFWMPVLMHNTNAKSEQPVVEMIVQTYFLLVSQLGFP